MKAFIFSLALAATILSISACNKDDDGPVVAEPELITTLRITLTDTTAGSSTQTFVYRVDNGFGSTSPGTVQIDTLRLQASRVYDATLTVLNEQESPAEDVTEEILSESDDHLFLLNSAPETGAGSIASSGGNTDSQGRPLNQTVRLTTAVAGSGQLTITLLHEPTDKNASEPAAAGGETDAEAIFPVVLIP